MTSTPRGGVMSVSMDGRGASQFKVVRKGQIVLFASSENYHDGVQTTYLQTKCVQRNQTKTSSLVSVLYIIVTYIEQLPSKLFKSVARHRIVVNESLEGKFLYVQNACKIFVCERGGIVIG